MYTELDNGVGRVVEALKAKGMWNETLLVFVRITAKELRTGCGSILATFLMAYAMRVNHASEVYVGAVDTLSPCFSDLQTRQVSDNGGPLDHATNCKRQG